MPSVAEWHVHGLSACLVQVGHLAAEMRRDSSTLTDFGTLSALLPLPRPPPHAMPRPAMPSGEYHMDAGTCHTTKPGHTMVVCLPSLVMPGVMKGGTTEFSAEATQHPIISHSRGSRSIMEIHWFNPDWAAANLSKTARATAYMAKGQWPPGKYGFDRSTDYLPEARTVFPRMHSLMPSVRLIVLLREPGARMFSQYNNGYLKIAKHIKRGEPMNPVYSCLAAPSDAPECFDTLVSYVATCDAADQIDSKVCNLTVSLFYRSCYLPQLLELSRNYPSQQVAVLVSERFFADVNTTLNAVWSALGLPLHNHGQHRRLQAPCWRPEECPNQTKVRMLEQTKRNLQGLFSPQVEALAQLMPHLELETWWPGYWS